MTHEVCGACTELREYCEDHDQACCGTTGNLLIPSPAANPGSLIVSKQTTTTCKHSSCWAGNWHDSIFVSM